MDAERVPEAGTGLGAEAGAEGSPDGRGGVLRVLLPRGAELVVENSEGWYWVHLVAQEDGTIEAHLNDEPCAECGRPGSQHG